VTSISRRELFQCMGGAALALGARTRALVELGYQGWIDVEQDFTTMTPGESCRTSMGYVRDVLSKIYT